MIPLVDLKAQYRSIKSEIDEAIQEVLDNAWFILGPRTADFEKLFAAYTNTKYASGVSTGTSALHLALLTTGIGSGSEVITTPFTFVATVASIMYAGARPALVDIDPRTYNIDPARIEAAVTPYTRAIMPVHLYGQCADMDPILDIARRHKLLVIEDAAQAHGAEYKGRRAGSMGDIACFSFYPGKNLGAYGEGGAVVTNNPDYDKKVRMLRDWGMEHKNQHDLLGFNARMQGIQGAVLKVKMKYIEKWTEARRANARKYLELLKDVDGVVTPVEADYARHVFHCFVVRVQNRDEVHRRLVEAGIGAGIHYPLPVHLQKGYAELGYKTGAFPIAEKLASEVITLPLFPEMTEEQITEVVGTLMGSVA
jgi:dTDP-4-amino-4,6-dideoxygalactose transaminase